MLKFPKPIPIAIFQNPKFQTKNKAHGEELSEYYITHCLIHKIINETSQF